MCDSGTMGRKNENIVIQNSTRKYSNPQKSNKPTWKGAKLHLPK